MSEPEPERSTISLSGRITTLLTTGFDRNSENRVDHRRRHPVPVCGPGTRTRNKEQGTRNRYATATARSTSKPQEDRRPYFGTCARDRRESLRAGRGEGVDEPEDRRIGGHRYPVAAPADLCEPLRTSAVRTFRAG